MSDQVVVPLYSGWRRVRGLGLGGLSSGQTMLLLGTVMAAAMVSMLPIPYARALSLVIGGLGLLLFGVSLLTWDGTGLLDYHRARVSYLRRRRRGETEYVGHVFAPVKQSHRLPGVLASCALLDVESTASGVGVRSGLVWDKRSGYLSGTALLSPRGTLLTDPGEVVGFVTAWDAQLAALATSRSVQWLTITIDVSPEGGASLRANMKDRRDPDAPAYAASLLDELISAAPDRASLISTRATLTVDPTRDVEQVANIEEAASVALRALDAFDPTGSGAQKVRLATVPDLARMVRVAFDPEARRHPASEWQTQSSWAESAPLGAKAERDYYAHDGGFSMSFVKRDLPRQEVGHNILLPLMQPGRFARRVTLQYRVLPTDMAGELVEREQTAARTRTAFRRARKADETERDQLDSARTRQVAQEESRGAGITNLDVYVTTTVDSLADLSTARAEVEASARQSKIDFRLARFSQDVAFAVGLPCGICPPFQRKGRVFG